MHFSEEQIWVLAPDEASKKAGKDLSIPQKWVTKGSNNQVIWGECLGSGSKPYQTQIHIESVTFKCSCPSRKFPCKHSIGLLLLHAKNNTLFTETTQPDWVTDWLAKKNEQSVKKTVDKEKVIDEVAQSKRLQAREQLVENGLNDVLLWMKDWVKNGIVSMPEKGTHSFDELAKRMIDAKAPGIANLIKKLSTIDFYKEGWENDFLSQLVHIYSIITAYKNASSINSLLMDDVKNLIGFTTKQEQLLTYDGITDNWLVIGKEQLQEDTILVERNWLYGIESKKYALILQFSVRWQINSALLIPGSCIHATLIFYPSAMPLRAIVKEQHNIAATPQNIAAFLNWKEVADSCIKSRQILPFNQDLPFIVQQVTPLFYQNTWWLKDEESSIVKLEATENVLYNLLALSGGNAITVTVIGNNHIFKPIGVWKHHQFISL